MNSWMYVRQLRVWSTFYLHLMLAFDIGDWEWEWRREMGRGRSQLEMPSTRARGGGGGGERPRPRDHLPLAFDLLREIQKKKQGELASLSYDS
eukprot:scaffold141555_cov27-Tisochrysis_lutea.AAC.1